MDPAAQSQAPTDVEAQEDKEWDQATNNFLEEKGVAPETSQDPKKDPENPDPAKPTEQTDEEKKALEDAEAKRLADEKEAELAKDETPEQTEARHKKEADDKAAEEAAAASDHQPDTSREIRATQREMAAEEKATKDDIREAMFSDTPTELLDQDGEPIRTIEDVMGHMNNVTGKPFTEEEAAAWLLRAQQSLNATREQNEKRIEEIAELNISLKEQADAMKAKYMPLLTAMDKTRPDFSKNLLNEWKKTLKTDPQSGIIIEAPVSLEWFYSTNLAPYEHLASEIETRESLEKKHKEEIERLRNHSDRSDIYGGVPSDPIDEDEDEWNKAIKKQYS